MSKTVCFTGHREFPREYIAPLTERLDSILERLYAAGYRTFVAGGAEGFDTLAAGDSVNDRGMIRASRAGFLFRSTEQIKADNPDLPAFEEFDDFLNAIRGALKG